MVAGAEQRMRVYFEAREIWSEAIGQVEEKSGGMRVGNFHLPSSSSPQRLRTRRSGACEIHPCGLEDPSCPWPGSVLCRRWEMCHCETLLRPLVPCSCPSCGWNIIVSILHVMVNGFWANSKVYSSQVFPPPHPQIFLLSDAAPPFFIHHPAGGSVTCNDKKMKVIKRDLSSCVAFSFIFILMGMALNNSEQPLSLSIHHHYSQGKNNSSIHSRSRSFCRDFSSCPFLSEVIHSFQLKWDMSSV